MNRPTVHRLAAVASDLLLDRRDAFVKFGAQLRPHGNDYDISDA